MSRLASKLATLEEAVLRVRRWQKNGEEVVMANGVFDLLHVGHLRYLEDARTRGDRLVVGVNSDASAHALKGHGRPVVAAAERATLVAALRAVDLVVVFEEHSADALLVALAPNTHAKGTDYTADTVPERETAAAHGTKTAIAGDPKGHASRELIERIRDHETGSR